MIKLLRLAVATLLAAASVPARVAAQDVNSPAQEASRGQPSGDPAKAPSATFNHMPPNALVGLPVFSSDGYRIGRVEAVNVQPDGTVRAINVRSGGFLGIGSRLVSIPAGTFSRAGQHVKVGLSAEEIGKLPSIAEQ
jgi:sporulation protein YlmC with PRC-barrel domain